MVKLACFPCEIQHREFDSKLLLASRVVSTSSNNIALIGYDRYFNSILQIASASFLLDKSMSTLMLNSRIRPCKERGGYVFINDEEGVNDLDETPEALDIRLDQRAIPFVDKYLAWGRDDASFFASRKSALASKILIIGSHRYDLLNHIGHHLYREEIAAIKLLFGDFILFNDNLAVDHYDKNYAPPTHLFQASKDSQDRADKEWDEIVEEHTLRRERVTSTIFNLLKVGLKVVIRPHPVYDPLYWCQKFRLHPNVQVIYQGPVEPWIHASRAVITTGCTTGLQSLYAKKPSYELSIGAVSRAFSSQVLPKCDGWKSFTDESIKAASPAFDAARLLSKNRWNIHDSTTLEMAQLINPAMESLPHQDSLEWLSNIPKAYPQPPKWRNISSVDVHRRFSRILEVLGSRHSLQIQKVANSLYMISHKKI